MKLGYRLLVLTILAVTATFRCVAGEPKTEEVPATDIVRMELMDESPDMMPHVSELAGKRLQDVLAVKQIKRVIALKNRTSAMSEVHVARLRRLIEDNPTILPMWEKDERGALHLARDVDHQRQFFSAIVEKTDGTFVGVLMSSERTRIVTPHGAGIVERQREPNKPSEATP